MARNLTLSLSDELAKRMEEFPEDQMATADRVALTEAVTMYQPVKSASTGSRYFLLGKAIHKEVGAPLFVAARLVGKKLSIRVEGAALVAARQDLLCMGFDNKGDHYVSAHLSAGSVIDAAKAIGAVMSALAAAGCTVVSQIPDITKILGKGS